MSHNPTSETRAQVAALKSYGHTHDEIAKYLDIHTETLAFHYSRELATAQITANAEVARRLYNKATKSNDLSAQIFWLKTRARWRTQDERTLEEENADLKKEMIALREQLDAKNKKEY